MGEYATYKGSSVKMGTCENMYYLRYGQHVLVEKQPHSLDPRDPDTIASLRWRFPWPDEDGTEPGGYDNAFDRGITVPGFAAPTDVDHGTIQFADTRKIGYLINLPCPEGTPDARVHRNGFAGAVDLCQQKYVKGIGLVPVLRCGGCGARWRMEDRHEIEGLAVAFRSEGDRRRARKEDGDWWHAVADRLLEGLD